MPLDHSSSRAAFDRNVGTLMGEVGSSPHVQSRDQALAIAYDIKRRGRALGGATNFDWPSIPANVREARLDELKDIKMPSEGSTRGKAPGFALGGSPAPWFVRSESRAMLHSGPINSIVPGRTDHHPLHVASGSYVLPADHVSSLGQGNSQAGMAVINHMFTQGPYGSGSMKIAHGAGAPKPPRVGKFADGGASAGGDGEPVPIMAAGGEFVLTPDQVRAVGDGDTKLGHARLDKWVVENRKRHVKTLTKLPGPAKS